MEFSRQEYRHGLPFPTPGDLPDPGLEPVFPAPPALAGRFFTTEPAGKALCGAIDSQRRLRCGHRPQDSWWRPWSHCLPVRFGQNYLWADSVVQSLDGSFPEHQAGAENCTQSRDREGSERLHLLRYSATFGAWCGLGNLIYTRESLLESSKSTKPGDAPEIITPGAVFQGGATAWQSSGDFIQCN